MDIVSFYKKVKSLKDIKREGWVERGVDRPESLADHSFMTALLCMAVPAERIDRERAVKMAIVHDIGASLAGDRITKESWPGGGSISGEEKRKIGEKALKEIVSHLDDSNAREISDLWTEFRNGKTEEAVFVRDACKADLMMQAHEYHMKGNSKKPMEGFWDERNMGLIKNENIKSLVKDIIPMGR